MSLWFGSVEVHRSFTLPAVPARVHEILRDPAWLPRLHPLIHRVVVTSRAEEGGEHVVRFEIDEHLPMFGLRVPNHYRGENRWRDVDALDLRGFAGLGVVEQRSAVRAPRVVLGYVVRTANAAHERLIDGLREALS